MNYTDQDTPGGTKPSRGRIRRELAPTATVADNLRYHGTEFQITEIFNYWDGLKLFWTVNHFHAGDGNGNTTNPHYTINLPTTRSPYTIGIEFTPRGYAIWYQSDGETWPANPRSKAQPAISKGPLGERRARCRVQALNGVFVIPCGIPHVPISVRSSAPIVHSAYPEVRESLQIFFTRARFANGSARVIDRTAALDYIRLYKPINNYEDLEPLYQ